MRSRPPVAARRLQPLRSPVLFERVPKTCAEALFVGSGGLGSLCYFEGSRLRLTLDDPCLWEERDSTSGLLPATYAQVRKHPEGFYACDHSGGIPPGFGRTRLPALALSVGLKFEPASFTGSIDIGAGRARFQCADAAGVKVAGELWVGRHNDVLDLTLRGPVCAAAVADFDGWRLDKPGLEALSRMGYEPPHEQPGQGVRHFMQAFSGTKVAVVSLKEIRSDSHYRLLCTMGVGASSEADALAAANGERLKTHARFRGRAWAEHLALWAQCWSGADITVPEERLKEAMDAERYKLFCNCRRGGSTITLQGLFNSDVEMPPWCGDLHNNLNVQACYWAAFRFGCFDLVDTYLGRYAALLEAFGRRGRAFYGVEDVLHVPLCMSPDGYGVPVDWCFWNALTGCELLVAADFCWYFEFTQDRKRLIDWVLPFLRRVAATYEHVAEPGADGRLHVPLTHSPEVFEDGRMLMGHDSTYALSCLHHVLGRLAAWETDASLQPRWVRFKEKLVVPKVSNAGLSLFADRDLWVSHRHFGHFFPVFPLNELDRANPDDDALIQASLDHLTRLGTGEFASWSFPYLAILAARAGRGEMADLMLEIYLRGFRSGNTFTVNGDAFRVGILAASGNSAGAANAAFTLEAGLMVPAAVAEMLVHRAGNTLHVLPGLPQRWRSCSAQGLVVEGGHRVDVVFEDDRLVRLDVTGGSDETLGLCSGRPAAAALPRLVTLRNGHKISLL